MSTEIQEERTIHKVSRVTESTLFPLSLIFVMIGCVYWVSSLAFQVTASAKSIEKLEDERKEYLQNVQELKTDIATIKGMLEEMKRGSR